MLLLLLRRLVRLVREIMERGRLLLLLLLLMRLLMLLQRLLRSLSKVCRVRDRRGGAEFERSPRELHDVVDAAQGLLVGVAGRQGLDVVAAAGSPSGRGSVQRRVHGSGHRRVVRAGVELLQTL